VAASHTAEIRDNSPESDAGLSWDEAEEGVCVVVVFSVWLLDDKKVESDARGEFGRIREKTGAREVEGAAHGEAALGWDLLEGRFGRQRDTLVGEPAGSTVQAVLGGTSAAGRLH
jgi:hypothetical protein